MILARNIHHSFKSRKVLNGISFELQDSQLLCLTGPSGCGKTTLLRLVAGLEQIQSGEIFFKNQVIANSNFQIPPQERRFGFVFQNPVLFPHLNVLDNIGFGLKGKSKSEKQIRSKEMLELVGLKEHAHKFSHQLSGGQIQRVAFARALAPKPVLMLLDEPFSNLDPGLKSELADELLGIVRSSQVPAILVSHDPSEALSVSDSMVLLGSNGELLQHGEPQWIRNHPATLEVARFFGDLNISKGSVIKEQIHSEFPLLEARDFPVNLEDKSHCLVVTRPEGIRLGTADHEYTFSAKILSKVNTGIAWKMKAQLNSGKSISFFVLHDQAPKPGQKVQLILQKPHVFVFAES